MKTSAVIRIILWSMVVVLLTCILAVGLSGGELLGRPLPFGFPASAFRAAAFPTRTPGAIPPEAAASPPTRSTASKSTGSRAG